MEKQPAPPRLLLLEDDPTIVKFVAGRFGQLGYDVRWANRMDEALELFRGHGADVVLTDFHVQHGNGRRMLHEVRKLHSSVPVFLMTGTPFVDEQTFSGFGFSGVFLKPFSMDALVAEVTRAVQPRTDG